MQLNGSSSIALHLKTRSIPKSQFRNILVEHTTIIAHEINKLRQFGKNLETTLLFIDFSKIFDSIQRRKMVQILLDYGLPKETTAAIMNLYKNMKVKVRSPD